jgi:hypothetical protein
VSCKNFRLFTKPPVLDLWRQQPCEPTHHLYTHPALRDKPLLENDRNDIATACVRRAPTLRQHQASQTHKSELAMCHTRVPGCSVADVNTLLDSSGAGWVLWEAAGINDNHQIVAMASLPSMALSMQFCSLPIICHSVMGYKQLPQQERELTSNVRELY